MLQLAVVTSVLAVVVPTVSTEATMPVCRWVLAFGLLLLLWLLHHWTQMRPRCVCSCSRGFRHSLPPRCHLLVR